MFENVSIGDLAATALATGAVAITQGVGGQSLENSYNALRAHVWHWCPREMNSLEQLPHSVARRGIVAFMMDNRPEEFGTELRALVENLIDGLKMNGPASGVDMSYLLLLETHFNKPKVKQEKSGVEGSIKKRVNNKKQEKRAILAKTSAILETLESTAPEVAKRAKTSRLYSQDRHRFDAV